MNKSGFLGKMQRFLTGLFVYLIATNTLYAQDVHTGSVVFDKNGFSFDIRVLYENTEIKTLPNVNYYWYRNGELKSTIGDFSGNILHGKYEKFDADGNLRAKGDFLYGVKNGKWKYWNNRGTIDTEEFWKKGFLVERISINDSTITIQPFKNNVLHGKVVQRKNNELISSVKYYQGKKKVKKTPRLFVRLRGSFKKKKIKSDDTEEMQTILLED